MRKTIYFILICSSISCTENAKRNIYSIFKSDDSLNSEIKYVEVSGKKFQSVERTIGKFHFEYLSLSTSYGEARMENNSSIPVMNDEVNKNYSPGIFKIRVEGQQDELLQLDLSSEEQYKQRVEYYSFKINNDLKMVYGTDTLKCLFSTFERTYGLSPEITINCYFEKPKMLDHKDEYTIVFDDKIFNCGIVNLRMPSVNI